MRETGINHQKSKLIHFTLVTLSFFAIAFVYLLPSRPAWSASPAPSDLAAKAVSSNQISLSWQSGSGDGTGYNIERSTNSKNNTYSSIATVDANTTTFTDSGLTQNTVYYYRVSSVRTLKNGNTIDHPYSDDTSATTFSLVAPIGLIATATSPSQITLSWDKNTNFASQYLVERGVSQAGPFTEIGAAGGSDSTYSDNNLSQNTTYYYRVRAFDGTNYSTYSNVANETIITITATAGSGGSISPSGVVLVKSGANQTIAVNPATGYRIADVSVDGVSVGTVSAYTFNNVTTSHAITAKFAIITFTINALGSGNGSITPSGPVIVNFGSSQTFSITANAGYTIISLLVDGQSVAIQNNYTFTNVTSDHSITSTFADTTPPTGSISINGKALLTNSTNVKLGLSAADSGSGVAQMSFSNDLVNWSPAELFANNKDWTLNSGDSAKTVYVKYSDNAGNWSDAYAATITLDTTPPSTTISPNPGIYKTAQTITLTPSEASTIYYTTDGSTPSSSSSFYTAPLTINSTTTLNYFAVDLAGNPESIKTATFTIDTQPPTLTLLTPVDGSYTNNVTLVVTGTVTDNTGLQSVTVNNVPVAIMMGNFSQQVTLIPGANTITTVATDLAGNQTTDIRQIVLDQTPPTLTLSAAADGSYTNNATLIIAGKATDNFAVQGVTVNGLPSTVNSDGTFSQMVALTAGANRITTTASDQAGNQTTDIRTITLDQTSPVLTIDTLPDGSFSNNATLNISGTATDNAAFSSLSINGVSVTVTADGTFNQVITLVTGTNTIRTVAMDQAGNSASDTRSIILDQTAPVVTITSPVSGTTANPTQTLIFSVSDGSVIVKVDGVINNLVSGSTIGPLSNGQHAVIVQSTDAAGNIGTAQVNFTVMLLQPQVAAGGGQSFYLNTNGALAAWGHNNYGQVGDGTTINRVVPVRVGTLVSWAKIAAGSNHTVAINSNGTLWAWGYNYDGELGNGTTVNSYSPVKIGPDTTWQSVSAGGGHTMAIKSDGSLWAWGSNSSGQLGDGTGIQRNYPVPISNGSTWSTVSAGNSHTVAVKNDGTLWAWGYNNNGQLGNGTTVNSYSPVKIGTDTRWQSISAGGGHTMGIKSDGSLWAWGGNWVGQLGDGTTTNRVTPTQISAGSTWKSVSAGIVHTIAIRSDGSLWAWGNNSNGQLGDGTTTQRLSPVQIGFDTTWIAVSAGAYYTLAVKSDGSVWAWGYNAYNQLGDSTTINKLVPVQPVISPAPAAPTGLSALALSQNQIVLTWSNNASTEDWNVIERRTGAGADFVPIAQLSANSTSYASIGLSPLTTYTYRVKAVNAAGDSQYSNEASATTLSAPTYPIIEAGGGQTIYLGTGGQLAGWGYNYYGQVGDGTTTNRTSPVAVGIDTAWAIIAAGGRHSVAIKNNGTLWAWGYNSLGQLGDSTTVNKNMPMQIGVDTNWRTVSAGSSHTVALKADGTLWAWGDNSNAQLGDGTMTQRNIPTQIGSDTTWAVVSAGDYHTMALKGDGTLWGWGNDGYGQLGDGSSSTQYSPKQIGTETWATISSGGYHTMGLKANGTLWAWGNNRGGQLGNGTTTNQTVPVQIGTWTWKAVSAGSDHTVAIRSDGTLWAWGGNSSGQLGDGTTTQRNSPVQIGNDTTWVSVSTGSWYTFAVKADGTVWSWGYNWYGQLGDSTTGNKSFPIQIGLDCLVSINGGSAFTNTPSVILTLQTLNGSVTGMQFSNDNTNWTAPESFVSTKTWTLTTGDGLKTVYVKLQNNAGTWSNAYRASITLDTTSPTGTIKINNGATYTTLTSVSLNLSAGDASGILQMQFSNDGATWSTAEPFNATKSWNLSAGDGIKTVYVKFMDGAGNWSTQPCSAIIILDTMPPVVSIISPTGLTNKATPLLSYSATTGTTVVKVDSITVNKRTGDQLDPLPDGSHKVRVEATDALGVTTFAEVTFTVDTTPPATLTMSNNSTFSAGYLYSLAVSKDGHLLAWGQNNNSQLGDGTTTSRSVPSLIGSSTWISTAAGNGTSFGVQADGSLWAWGSNWYGNIGDGTRVNKQAPVQIGTDHNWKFVSAGSEHTIALKADGSLWAWGNNSYGQLGDGTYNDHLSPVLISAGTIWSSISAGNISTLAIKADGTLWSWGANNAVPSRIGSDNDWVSVAAAWGSSYAIKSNGTLWAWGSNGYGQLGDGTTVDKANPVQIGIGNSWVAIASSSQAYHVLALKSDETLWAWGQNSCGQLGDGTTTDKHTPIQIGTSGDWSSITAGSCHSMALKTDGTLWAWGHNGYGELGDGTNQQRTTPRSINAIVINNDSSYTSNPQVALSLNAWDALSGIAYMQFSNDGTNWSSPEPYASTKNWSLSSGDGTKNVYVMFEDAATNWSSEYSASITLDTTAPLVTIASPASGSVTNNMPLLNFAINDTTHTLVVVKIDGSIVNKTSGDLLDPLPAGNHLLRVEATDSVGQMSFAEAPFTVNSVSTSTDGYIFSDVALSSNTLNAFASETSTIFFTINSAATVALKIIPEKLGPNGTPVYQMSQDCPSAGAYLFTWNGFDSTGKIVPDEAYLYILEASDGVHTAVYSPAAPGGIGSITCSLGSDYDPYKNIPLTINYSVSQPSRVDLGVNFSGSILKVVSSLPFASGSYSYYWNGRSLDGNIVMIPSPAAQCAVVSLLGPNVIITSGNTPIVSALKTDPYEIQLSYGEFTRITYTLSQDANVTVKLTSSTGSAITLVNAQLQAAGSHEIDWNGIDTSDPTAKKLVLTGEGDYTVLVTAVNTTSGSSYSAKGCLKIWK